MLSLPRPASERDLLLDNSWEQALAYLYRHHAQAGKDYIFAYGPLGVYYTQVYDAELYWLKFGWEILLKLALASIAVAAVRRMPGAGLKIAYCFLFFTFLGENRGDTLFPHLFLAAALILCDRGSLSTFFALFLALLAVIALVKFSFFVLALLYVLIFTGFIAARGRWRAACLTPALFAIFCLAVWIGLGQSVAYIPGYLRGSVELTQGYAAAMSNQGDLRELPLALIIVLSLGGLFLMFDLRHVPRAKLAAVILLVACGLFQQWKSGFTRHDGHSYGFFTYSMLLPFLLPIPFGADQRRLAARRLLTALCVLLSIVGYQMSTHIEVAQGSFLTGGISRFLKNLGYVWAPRQMKSTLDQAKASFSANWQLPGIQAQVAGATIDLLTENLSVLFANELSYHPRPVLQSSSAYTGWLLQANTDFVKSEVAPEYLLLYWISIDGRLPSLEDNQALLVILDSYDPVLVEKGFLLLRRRPHSNPPPQVAREVLSGKVLLERPVGFEENVDVSQYPDAWQTLTAKMKYSLWGKIRSFLYKPPPVFINLKVVGDGTLTFRLIPAMCEDGFLINPLIVNQGDILKLYGLPGSTRVESFSFSSTELGPKSYAAEIGVTLKSKPDLAPRPLPADAGIKQLRRAS